MIKEDMERAPEEPPEELPPKTPLEETQEDLDKGGVWEIPAIEDATSFDWLLVALTRKGEIVGSGGEKYSVEDLERAINTARSITRRIKENYEKRGKPIKDLNGLKDAIEHSPALSEAIFKITRSEGLREKVVELLLQQEIMAEGGKEL